MSVALYTPALAIEQGFLDKLDGKNLLRPQKFDF